MTVPDDIRAVPRPTNTIVDDSGRERTKRCAVRERASTKYAAGGNPQPRTGSKGSDWQEKRQRAVMRNE